MVSSAHRFLHRLGPDGGRTNRHYLLQGAGVRDVMFHDMYYGCVSVTRSLELWGLQEWGGDGAAPVVVVRLTDRGALDFSGNEDPAEAERVLRETASGRPPRYERRAPGTRLLDEEPGADDDAADANRAAAERAARAVGDEVGETGGLVNRMNLIAAAVAANSETRFLIVVDDLGGQLDTLVATNQAAVYEEVMYVLKKRWLTGMNQTTALTMYLDRDRRLAQAIGDDIPGVGVLEVGKPSAREISEALRRIDARVPLGLDPDGPEIAGIANALSDGYDDLRSALGNIARVRIRDEGRVSLNGVLDLPPVDDVAVESILAELDELVGLEELKANVRSMVRSAQERRRRLERDGVAPEETLHLVFVGNPGTGKTTVARIIARLFHALGALPSDTLIEASAKDIKSEFRGETTKNMERVVRSAIGGVLFLDEAQQFGNAEDFRATEAIEALVPMAWNHRHELVVILAGYAAGMTDVMSMDVGLPRRFPRSRWFEFQDYTLPELWTVLEREVRRRALRLDASILTPLHRLLKARSSRGAFGNAGGVGNLVSEVQAIHDARDGAEESLLTADDLPPKVVRRPEEYAEALALLEGMTGLTQVKAAFRTLRGALDYAELEDEDVPLAPRFRFVGPPGTGKTTVARLIGQLLYGMGLLSRKQVIEVMGADLKAAYVGQSAPLVASTFDQARGGVLFIDEAHSLIPEDSFARDALSALVAQLTLPENRDTVVILAGYPDQIGRLLDSDPGLSRRFGSELVFDQLTPDECVEVARRVLASDAYRFTADEEFFEVLAARASEAMRHPGFGNAGWVETQIEAAATVMKARVVENQDRLDAAGRRRLIAADLGGDVTPTPARPRARRRLVAIDTGFAATEPVLPTPFGAAPADSITTRLRESVALALLSSDAGQAAGTAFAVTADHVFVTNRHVVESGDSIELRRGDSVSPARVIAVDPDPDVDLALVAVSPDDEVASMPPLPLGESLSLPDLRELVVVGNAKVRAREKARVITARVGRNQETDDVHFETDGAIEEGFSGGPLWDATQGAVVGVVMGGSGTNIKIAIRAEKVRALLESVGYRTEEDPT